MNNSHRIYKQILEISFSSRKEAMEGQEQISGLYKHDIMPLINDIFDGVLSTDDHIRIDHLEIDVGRVSLRNVKEDLKQGIRKRLEDELLKKIQQARLIPEQVHSEPMSRLEEATVSSAGTSDLQLFIFFVKTGQRPWWAGQGQVKSFRELTAKVINEQPEPLSKVLVELVPHRAYRRRLIYQLPDELLEVCIALIERAEIKQLAKLHKEFYVLQQHRQIVPLNRANFRRLLWETAFEFWFERSSRIQAAKTPPQDIGRGKQDAGKAITSYVLRLAAVLASRQKQARARKKGQPAPGRAYPFVVKLQEEMEQTGNRYQLLKNTLSSVMEAYGSNLENAFSDIDPDSSTKIWEKKNKEEVEAEAKRLLKSEETIEVHNAGLVIIAPFLPAFFDCLGLVDETTFMTEEAARRAALLLQYAATGETEIPEHELILNKILCGLPIHEPLPYSLEISERETEEVEKLLQSVIEHWEVLKSTSIEALRQTFLIKSGTLEQDINGWRLRVARTTVDILLDKLPWSISVIKLPWNNYMIHVEW